MDPIDLDQKFWYLSLELSSKCALEVNSVAAEKCRRPQTEFDIP